MSRKNNFFTISILILNSSILSAMDPIDPTIAINRIFLNACKNDRSIDFALTRGANIKAIDPDNNYNGLHYACENGNIDRITFFRENGLIIDDLAKICLGKALLSLSANKEMLSSTFCEQAQILLDLGADINSTDAAFYDFSPLSYACLNCQYAKAVFLLQQKANVNHKSKMGPPLYLLFMQSKAIILPNDAHNHAAVLKSQDEIESGRFAIMSLLLKKDANVTITGPGNHSVLQTAILGENTKCITDLIETKKGLDSVDTHGQNALYPLLTAYTPNPLPLLKILLKSGVKPLIDAAGQSLMHAVALRAKFRPATECISIIKKLLKANVGVNDKDNNGQTPLHYATKHADPTIIQKLLNAGAQQFPDHHGITPIQLAKNNTKYTKQIIQILKKGPSKNIIKSNVMATQSEKIIQEKNTKPKQKTPTIKKKNKKTTKKIIQSSGPESINIEPDNSQPAKSTLATQAPVILAKQVEVSTEKSIKSNVEAVAIIRSEKQKRSLLEQAQEKVIKMVTGESSKAISQKTYAQALHVNAIPNAHNTELQEEKKAITTLIDDHMTITVQPSHQLMIAHHDHNPLADINQHSDHVLEKMAHPSDIFHNFSPRVEKNLGHLSSLEHTEGGIKYTIPAMIRTTRGEFNGTFEFIIKNNMMVHRFYKPEKKEHKKLTAPKDIN